MKKFIVMLIMVCFVLSIGSLAITAEEKFPTKTIRIISPWGLGGTTGLLGQVIAPYAEQYFGVPVIVEEKAGGAGVVGTAYVLSKPADGYTIVLANKGNMITTPLLAGAPYNYTDFMPLLQIATQPLVVLVGGKTPYMTLDELLEANRKNPDAVRWANTGFGNQPHLFFEIFKVITGIDMISVAFDGWGGASTALLGGHVEAAMGNLDGTAVELIKEGAYRALAVFDKQRHPALPDVPTITETGMTEKGKEGAFLKFLIWRGLAVRADTPESVVRTLAEGFKALLENPEFLAKLANLELDIAYLDSKGFKQVWVDEFNAWNEFIPRIR